MTTVKPLGDISIYFSSFIGTPCELEKIYAGGSDYRSNSQVSAASLRNVRF